MGAFEHVISLLSFVFALAITHLLTTVAGFVRSWERVRVSGPHALWLLNSIAVTLPALFRRNRRVQLGSPLALMAIWVFYFADLQEALT